MKTWAEGNYCIVCHYGWEEYQDYLAICEEHKKEKEEREKENKLKEK